MNDLISIPTEQAFWQGLSAHFMHLEAQKTASFQVQILLWKSLVQLWRRSVLGILLNLILCSSLYFSLVQVSMTCGLLSWGAVGRMVQLICWEYLVMANGLRLKRVRRVSILIQSYQPIQQGYGKKIKFILLVTGRQVPRVLWDQIHWTAAYWRLQFENILGQIKKQDQNGRSAQNDKSGSMINYLYQIKGIKDIYMKILLLLLLTVLSIQEILFSKEFQKIIIKEIISFSPAIQPYNATSPMFQKDRLASKLDTDHFVKKRSRERHAVNINDPMAKEEKETDKKINRLQLVQKRQSNKTSFKELLSNSSFLLVSIAGFFLVLLTKIKGNAINQVRRLPQQQPATSSKTAPNYDTDTY